MSDTGRWRDSEQEGQQEAARHPEPGGLVPGGDRNSPAGWERALLAVSAISSAVDEIGRKSA